jgi:hypothetical protein
VFGKKGGSKGLPFFLWCITCALYLHSNRGEVYRDVPVMFIWQQQQRLTVPVKFPWRNSSTIRKKNHLFFSKVCELVKMYYLCTSNKSNNLNI